MMAWIKKRLARFTVKDIVVVTDACIEYRRKRARRWESTLVAWRDILKIWVVWEPLPPLEYGLPDSSWRIVTHDQDVTVPKRAAGGSYLTKRVMELPGFRFARNLRASILSSRTDMVWNRDLAERGQRAKDNPGVCELHGMPLREVAVPIHYGFFLDFEHGFEPDCAEEDGFPHARESMRGGCCVEDEKETIVLQCPQCMAAKKAWEAQHPELPDP